jgi:PelA/Pel-15E family pectate lyase
MKPVLNFSILYVFILCSVACVAQTGQAPRSRNYLDLSWREVATRMPDEWYGSDEAKMAADSVLKYQTEIGGWPKNSNFHKGVDQEEMARIKATGLGATFDNGATTTEMIFLAKIYGKVKDERYLKAFNKAFNYILATQYKNGGWPQFYPTRPDNGVAYSSHITYNDNAMVNVMIFLRDVIQEKPLYAPMQISTEMRKKAQKAFENGISCILKTQIKVNGRLTVWCAQHDEFTLAPANARTYELASFSGAESVGITLLLMDIDNPSKEIIAAVNGSAKWFEAHKITGIKLSTETVDGKRNRIVVDDNTAPPIWARFYDLETGKPFFCDRDGIKKNMLAEIGYERRNGYSWYTYAPSEILQKYIGWVLKWKVN